MPRGRTDDCQVPPAARHTIADHDNAAASGRGSARRAPQSHYEARSEERYLSRTGLVASPPTIPGLAEVDGLVNLTAALLGCGYTKDDVAAILGGNLLRMLRQVLPAE